MSIKFNKKLGKTLGIYGDSFAVHPYKGKNDILLRPDWTDNKSLLKNKTLIEILRYNYLSKEKLANPKDNLYSNVSWWTYQITQMFEQTIHYGYSGSSIEHMLFSQIDVNDTFIKKYPNDPFAKNIVPDVMICLWTDPWRYYFDKSTVEFNEKELIELNSLGSIVNMHFDSRLKEYRFKNIQKRIKSLIEITSNDTIIQKKNSYKVMFDYHWSEQLKRKNPKVKIIHIECFAPHAPIYKEYQKNLPLKNNLWIENFTLDMLHNKEETETKVKDSNANDYLWKKYIGHLGNQKSHNFITKSLVKWIEKYDDIENKKFDFSDWQSSYNLL